ncbi:hypothetical protein [Myroides odoratus]|uniref:hypothetical protein n=1 Tax=Myroides odoratus TaxID=256 RepID=UPI003340B3F2
MNGYELSRVWFDFCFENPEKIKPNHTALYFFIIEHCNRLGWKENFGLPTSMTMEAIGMKTYKSYISTLADLIDFGFIMMIEKSKNQYTANIIALNKKAKAKSKALSKALSKAEPKQSQKQDQSKVSIDKPINNRTFKPLNLEHSKSHCGDKSPKGKKEIQFWKTIVEVWFDFYKSKFEVDPSFNAANGKHLKTILIRLEKLAKSKKIDWTEDVAKRSMEKFLQNAWEDQWLQQNFLLPNLSSKYDSIINKNHDGKSVNNSSSGKGYKPAYADTDKLVRELESDFENGNIPGVY